MITLSRGHGCHDQTGFILVSCSRGVLLELLLVLCHEQVGILDSGGLWQVQLARLLGRGAGSIRFRLRLGWGGLRLGVQLDGHVWLARPCLIT